MFRRYIIQSGTMLLAAVVLAGCRPDAADLDQREEEYPLVKRAIVKKRANDIEAAIKLLEKALLKEPQMARPHLELGLLYDDYREDYLRAIYHYETYLERRPRTEKREIIEDLIKHARLSYASALPNRPPGALDEINHLQNENRQLKAAVQRLQQASTSARAVSSDAPQRATVQSEQEARKPEPAPAPAQQAITVYEVQRGDTLSRIAVKMYNDASQWKTIFEANAETLKSPSSITVGQKLMIPR